jgi:hypothetical protein
MEHPDAASMAYLRHHGFPSPLLDWTASPYLAAFFALDSVPKHAEHVAVFVLIRDSVTFHAGDRPHMAILGPYVRSHPRHFIQQSQYSVCIGREDGMHVFAAHVPGMVDGVGVQGELLKVVIPVADRLDALRNLDQMNINKYSVYGSEDALVQTIARRECLL